MRKPTRPTSAPANCGQAGMSNLMQPALPIFQEKPEIGFVCIGLQFLNGWQLIQMFFKKSFKSAPLRPNNETKKKFISLDFT